VVAPNTQHNKNGNKLNVAKFLKIRWMGGKAYCIPYFKNILDTTRALIGCAACCITPYSTVVTSFLSDTRHDWPIYVKRANAPSMQS